MLSLESDSDSDCISGSSTVATLSVTSTNPSHWTCSQSRFATGTRIVGIILWPYLCGILPCDLVVVVVVANCQSLSQFTTSVVGEYQFYGLLSSRTNLHVSWIARTIALGLVGTRFLRNPQYLYLHIAVATRGSGKASSVLCWFVALFVGHWNSLVAGL